MAGTARTSTSRPFWYSWRAAASTNGTSSPMPSRARTSARRSGDQRPSASGSRPRGMTSSLRRGMARRRPITSATCSLSAWNPPHPDRGGGVEGLGAQHP